MLGEGNARGASWGRNRSITTDGRAGGSAMSSLTGGLDSGGGESFNNGAQEGPENGVENVVIQRLLAPVVSTSFVVLNSGIGVEGTPGDPCDVRNQGLN